MIDMELDWKKYTALARQAAAEGVVLLENRRGALPFGSGARISVFGRIQSHYYKSGTGSGGMVNTPPVPTIPEALRESGRVAVNEDLQKVYAAWEETHPFDPGQGWGQEPWAQEEMPVTQALCQEMAEKSDIALVILGRNAGEDRDSRDSDGAYRLGAAEQQLLSLVREAFPTMVVVLNTAAIMDLTGILVLEPDGLVLAWQGGQEGARGLADVLTGAVCPSGRLPDTIARRASDYPSAPNFGGLAKNFYQEDIYVGYRYFETATPDKVLYPFGFGLSYTTFSLHLEHFEKRDDALLVQISVENTGNVPGKEVVQVYGSAPQGALGKAARVLLGFCKTETLAQGQKTLCDLTLPLYFLASYDDSGATGHRNAYVLEAGQYRLYVGTDVRQTSGSISWLQPELQVLRQLTENLAPVEFFRRMRPHRQEDGSYAMILEDAPTLTKSESEEFAAELPAPLKSAKTGTLQDVAQGSLTLGEFVDQFTDEDLAAIVRGEGMGSPKVTAGTAAAFGGVTKSLETLGIPCGCCTDGPSGLRLDSGVQAFSLPGGTCLASSFNAPLNEALYAMAGLEMAWNHIDVLLGPGMNIHRHPLNGRNFEYFSEDPLLTGKIAAAQLRGLHSAGVTGCIKHFCGNNQETKRTELNDVVSQRALREIYLKGFEIAVTEGHADAVMTTYGAVNGVWTAGSYDLNTRILRQEWGFTGIVMTDWWAKVSRRGQDGDPSDLASMVLAQNDLYMVCPDVEKDREAGNLRAALRDPAVRTSAQRCAENICAFLLKTRSYARTQGREKPVTIVNRPQGDMTISPDDLRYIPIESGTELDLAGSNTERGASLILALEVPVPGNYALTLTARAQGGETIQIPVTVFVQGFPFFSYLWNGTEGQWQAQERSLYIRDRYSVARLYFGQSGLELKSLKFTLLPQ